MAPHPGFQPVLGTVLDNAEESDGLLHKMNEVDEALHREASVAMGHCGDAASTFRCGTLPCSS